MARPPWPPGDLSEDPPPYPGVGWDFKYLDKSGKNAVYLRFKTLGSRILSFGCHGNQTDESTYFHTYHCLNYLMSLGDTEWLKSQTQEQIYIALMNADNERYHLRGKQASKYSRESLINHRMGAGGSLTIEVLQRDAQNQMSLHRQNNARDYNGDGVTTPHGHIDAVTQFGGNGNGVEGDHDIDKLHRLFNGLFGPHFAAQTANLLDENGTEETFKELGRDMSRLLGGSDAGINLSEELFIEGCNEQRDIFIWKNTVNGNVNHDITIRYTNVKTLMFYIAMDKINNQQLRWEKDEIVAMIEEINDVNGAGTIWYVSTPPLPNQQYQQLTPYTISEVTDIRAECLNTRGMPGYLHTKLTNYA